MTPAPIDLKVVDDRLGIVASCVEDLRRLPGQLAEFRADFRNAPAADSMLRRAIEALFDTARHLLAKTHGLGALEYRDVARLAAEKGLVQDARLRERFVLIAGFRNRLTHFYDEITPDELFGIAHDDLGDLEAIAGELRRAATGLAKDDPQG